MSVKNEQYHTLDDFSFSIVTFQNKTEMQTADIQVGDLTICKNSFKLLLSSENACTKYDILVVDFEVFHELIAFDLFFIYHVDR